MRFTFFHWGLHPWAVYSAMALPLAYFHFRHQLPLAPRSLLYPLLGKNINGVAGHAVDILCTVGTLFGVATSLGLGAMQINTGLNQLADVPIGPASQVTLIVIITAIATISVVSGIHMGIRRLSEFNMSLAALILLFILVTGPTLYTIELFISSLAIICSGWWRPASGSTRAPATAGRRTGHCSTGAGGCPGRRLWASSWPGSPAAGPFASLCSAYYSYPWALPFCG
jgi:choline-glycine betaine transporter